MYPSRFFAGPTRYRFLVPAGIILLFLFLAACSKAEDTASSSVPTTASGLPRLVDLGADKCVPCVAMAPILAELKKDYAGRFEVEFIDVWKRREEAGRYGVKMIPTQIFYDGTGKELLRRSGFIGKEDILATWKKLGYDFDK
jgi:thioredoxin 1